MVNVEPVESTESLTCHPKLVDFANCMKKKGRGMSIFASTIDGDYYQLAVC
ncbi:hypothetical protein ZOSMA_4G00770 [Zostera marina]|uniref:Uncharacterized protein n=1 Tax=Zostera marina TaxID=29655 RepID=A0A0K9NYL0_ZOSMR|nr:hypothetical protein ZOSMA_4G00770 [Zostera marina]